MPFLQWFLEGIMYFTGGMISLAIIGVFVLMGLGTWKLVFNTIKKILQK